MKNSIIYYRYYVLSKNSEIHPCISQPVGMADQEFQELRTYILINVSLVDKLIDFARLKSLDLCDFQD